MCTLFGAGLLSLTLLCCLSLAFLVASSLSPQQPSLLQLLLFCAYCVFSSASSSTAPALLTYFLLLLFCLLFFLFSPACLFYCPFLFCLIPLPSLLYLSPFPPFLLSLLVSSSCLPLSPILVTSSDSSLAPLPSLHHLCCLFFSQLKPRFSSLPFLHFPCFVPVDRPYQ